MAAEPGPGNGITTAELEVGGVEGAGEAALLAAGMDSIDEALRKLPSATSRR